METSGTPSAQVLGEKTNVSVERSSVGATDKVSTPKESNTPSTTHDTSARSESAEYIASSAHSLEDFDIGSQLGRGKFGAHPPQPSL